ncbi:rhodanese-like domain-containing protein [Bacillus sp. FJAT-45037]|uniref:rhodanese-like domain-containing protein n=1 Tax=Bacillus sp. FJAT-45037 TaxID=2011007 RepID=UPI000C234C5A|nr:rhodanese-like domain-containing protein [Bacillus sp. FJAT-45037]
MKYFSVTVLAIIIGIGVFSLFQQSSNDVKEITTTELEKQMETDSEAIYVDVREVNEYEAGHVKGMENMPLSNFAENYSVLPKDREIVVFCRSGNRSMQAATFLADQGYAKVTNVEGGILAWEGPVQQ